MAEVEILDLCMLICEIGQVIGTEVVEVVVVIVLIVIAIAVVAFVAGLAFGLNIACLAVWAFSLTINIISSLQMTHATRGKSRSIKQALGKECAHRKTCT